MSKRFRESIVNEGPNIVRPRREESALEIIMRWCRVAESCDEVHPVTAAVRFGTAEDVIAVVEHGKECAERFPADSDDDEDEDEGLQPAGASGAVEDEDEDEEFKHICESFSTYRDDDRAVVSLRGFRRRLITDNDFDNKGLVSEAARANNLATVEYLLSRGARPNTDFGDMHTVSQSKVFTMPPLHCAVKVENATMVRVLLAADADVNRKYMADGHTALHYAAHNGNRAIFRMLLDAGADVNARNLSGHTALCYLVRETRMDMVRTMVDRGANIDANDYAIGSAILDAAAYCESPTAHKVVEELVRLGAATETPSKVSGATALIMAASVGKVEMTRVLLAARANVAAVDNSGMTALAYASLHGYHETMNLILDSPGGAETLETKDIFGRTALSDTLMRANACYGDNDVNNKNTQERVATTIDILLSRGAVPIEELHAVLKKINPEVYKRYFLR